MNQADTDEHAWATLYSDATRPFEQLKAAA